METEKPYLIKVDLSSVLKTQDSIYTLLINPAEMTLIFQLKRWIKYLFLLKTSISIEHDNSYIHDLESIAILQLLRSPARVRLCPFGLELGKDDFLNHLRGKDFSLLPYPTKKRLLEAAKRLGATYEDFAPGSNVSTPKENPSHSNSKSNKAPFEHSNIGAGFPAVTEADNTAEIGGHKALCGHSNIGAGFSELTEADNTAEIAGHKAVEKEDANILSDTSTTKADEFCQPNREESGTSPTKQTNGSLEKPLSSKRERPLSVGTFLTELREFKTQSCSEESLDGSAAKCHSQANEEWNEEMKPQKRKRVRSRVRGRKSKRSSDVKCEEASWALPLPVVFNKPSLAAQHIRFEDEELAVAGNPSGEIVSSQEVTDAIPEEEVQDTGIPVTLKETSDVVSPDLRLLFSLKNNFGSPPVFVRDQQQATQGFTAH